MQWYSGLLRNLNDHMRTVGRVIMFKKPREKLEGPLAGHGAHHHKRGLTRSHKHRADMGNLRRSGSMVVTSLQMLTGRSVRPVQLARVADADKRTHKYASPSNVSLTPYTMNVIVNSGGSNVSVDLESLR